ncbi:nucleotidyltransferase domain-containing protein [Candidatus Magnetobacterium casense]|uniref:Nucleotidyltransferase domain-containing protein n=1 Tax=Candidatus Magnetobacterium casense TaxID=1455061 RepID=A0ABS6RZ35_9BACT|nr:nucleotidyltransferase domain-containing protein [Candidatus Magnetobacterium casensis]MBV6341453.1 nucleotidyltransferase domain-containing protein [Candidatus Magnetobacterium casensis]
MKTILAENIAGNKLIDNQMISLIVDTILSFVKPERIIVFGSRVSGRGHEYSDYDIAIEGVKLDVRTSRLLREELDIRAEIYTIDLVELDRADDGFRELVKEGGIVIYEAGSSANPTCIRKDRERRWRLCSPLTPSYIDANLSSLLDPIMLEVIVDTILSFVKPEKVIVFGSRVSGKGHEYSEYDIAIEGVKLDVRTSRLLRETLDIRAGIYTIYLVELDRADDGFRALVKEGGIVIYEAG